MARLQIRKRRFMRWENRIASSDQKSIRKHGNGINAEPKFFDGHIFCAIWNLPCVKELSAHLAVVVLAATSAAAGQGTSTIDSLRCAGHWNKYWNRQELDVVIIEAGLYGFCHCS